MSEIPKPRKPEPLPGKWLGMRSAREQEWERLDRAGERKLREIQAWAEEVLTDLFMAQDLGGDFNDPEFRARTDGLYNAIRNSLTRQDLIMGFLLTVQRAAQEKAEARKKEFDRELKQLTEPDVF